MRSHFSHTPSSSLNGLTPTFRVLTESFAPKGLGTECITNVPWLREWFYHFPTYSWSELQKHQASHSRIRYNYNWKWSKIWSLGSSWSYNWRILSTQMEVIKTWPAKKLKKLPSICKWGCEGTSGESRYKQKFTDDLWGTNDNFVINIHRTNFRRCARIL